MYFFIFSGNCAGDVSWLFMYVSQTKPTRPKISYTRNTDKGTTFISKKIIQTIQHCVLYTYVAMYVVAFTLYCNIDIVSKIALGGGNTKWNVYLSFLFGICLGFRNIAIMKLNTGSTQVEGVNDYWIIFIFINSWVHHIHYWTLGNVK